MALSVVTNGADSSRDQICAAKPHYHADRRVRPVPCITAFALHVIDPPRNVTKRNVLTPFLRVEQKKLKSMASVAWDIARPAMDRKATEALKRADSSRSSGPLPGRTLADAQLEAENRERTAKMVKEMLVCASVRLSHTALPQLCVACRTGTARKATESSSRSARRSMMGGLRSNLSD